METRLGKLVRLLVPGHETHIVTSCHMVCSRHGHRERLATHQVLGSLMTRIYKDGDFFSSLMPPQAAFMALGVPSALYKC